MKPKVWLQKNGHIETIGRGRLSAAHIALIKDAVSNGEYIEGYSNTPDPAKAAVQDKPKRNLDSIPDVPDMTRDERYVSAYRLDDGKRITVGMRTVDNQCGSSLTYCACENPRVWVDHETECVVRFSYNNTKGTV